MVAHIGSLRPAMIAPMPAINYLADGSAELSSLASAVVLRPRRSPRLKRVLRRSQWASQSPLSDRLIVRGERYDDAVHSGSQRLRVRGALVISNSFALVSGFRSANSMMLQTGRPRLPCDQTGADPTAVALKRRRCRGDPVGRGSVSSRRNGRSWSMTSILSGCAMAFARQMGLMGLTDRCRMGRSTRRRASRGGCLRLGAGCDLVVRSRLVGRSGTC